MSRSKKGRDADGGSSNSNGNGSGSGSGKSSDSFPRRQGGERSCVARAKRREAEALYYSLYHAPGAAVERERLRKLERDKAVAGWKKKTKKKKTRTKKKTKGKGQVISEGARKGVAASGSWRQDRQQSEQSNPFGSFAFGVASEIQTVARARGEESEVEACDDEEPGGAWESGGGGGDLDLDEIDSPQVSSSSSSLRVTGRSDEGGSRSSSGLGALGFQLRPSKSEGEDGPAESDEKGRGRGVVLSPPIFRFRCRKQEGETGKQRRKIDFDDRGGAGSVDGHSFFRFTAPSVDDAVLPA